MGKSKHYIDWYEENTPQNEDEYEAGCLSASMIILIVFATLVVGLLLITKHFI